jgi:hypothetical protein
MGQVSYRDFYVYLYVRSLSSENGPVGSPYYVGKVGRDKGKDVCRA